MTSRITILASALAISVATVSCKKDLEPQESSVPLNQASATQTAQAAPQQQQVQPQQQMQVQPQMQQVPQQVQKTAPGMNPPHGQPGHRCDIPVGTPLSQPIKTATMQTPQQTVAQVQQPAVKTAPGMNPPHGQPGHRCDIAVGAPLNSPIKPTSVQTVSTPPADGSPVTITPAVIGSDGKITPGTGVNITTSQAPAQNAPAILQQK